MTRVIPVTNPEGIQAVATLAGAIWTEHYRPIIGPEQVDYMLDRYQSPRAIQNQIETGLHYFLLQEDHEYVGYLGIEWQDCSVFLSKLYVKADRRGQGCGKTALGFLESLAGEKGVRRIHLRVNKHNSDSLRAYERLGFRRVGAVTESIGHGFVMDDYLMEKWLPHPA